METFHPTHTLKNMPNTNERVRLALTLVGIAAAIICLFTCLYEVRSTASETIVTQLMEASEIVPDDFSHEIITTTVVSATRPFWKLEQ